MSEPLRSFFFAVALCVVCSVLLTAASTGLQRRQEHNMRLEKQRNVLKAVGLIIAGKPLVESQIEKIYKEKIKTLWVTPEGELVDAQKRGDTDLPLYVRLEDQTIHTYAVPVESDGLWGRIYGYLALENDGATVAGFTVFQHSETPGLGGEIEKEWFQKEWIGKKIVDKGGNFVSIRIARGEAGESVPERMRPHTVDGISGATLTGRYLTAGIRETLRSYEPVSIRFRKNMIAVP